MNEQLKTVKDVFKDFETTEQIKNARIKNINLYKKIEQISIELQTSNEKINLIDIYKFENYLKSRFKVKSIKVVLINDFKFDINLEWENINRYLNTKYPLTKAIFMNSKPILEDKILYVNLN